VTHFPTQFTPRRVGRWALIIAALFIVGGLLWSARSVLTPFILGVILAYLFLPLVNRLEHRMPRWAAILVVYLVAISLLVGFFAYIAPPLVDQIRQLINAFPSIREIQAELTHLLDEYEQLLANLPPDVRTMVQEAVTSFASQTVDTIRTNLVGFLQGVGQFIINSLLSVVNTVTFLLGFFLIPFWLFYVLMDQREGVATLNRTLPAWFRADFWAVTTIFDRVFSGYLRGQLILGFAVGVASAVGLTTLSLFGLEVDYILLLAVIAGITELIPIIGPIIGAVPAVILGFIDSPTTGVAVLLLYIGIQQLENNFLVPRIVGESVGLHPAVLMILLVVCSQVFGLAGAILSAPLGAVSRDVFTYLYGRLSEPPRPAGELPARLRDKPPEQPAPTVDAPDSASPDQPAHEKPPPEEQAAD
jgi:predicted PurR-regulated permease PerM